MADLRVKFIISKLAENINLSNATPVKEWYDKLDVDTAKKITKIFTNDIPAIFFYINNRSPLEIALSEIPADYPGSSVMIVPCFLKVDTDKNGANTNSDVLVAGIIIGDPIHSFYLNFSLGLSQILHYSIEQTDLNVNKKELEQLLSPIERKAHVLNSTVVSTKKSVKPETAENLREITISTLPEILTASRDDATVSKYAVTLEGWNNQIQNLLSVAEQVRKEDETS
jgi:hypothetical protein